MNNNSKPVVVGIGEILWDMLPGGKRAGGAPINFVYHAAALGAEGYAVSAVGNDADGRAIVAELKQNKIDHVLALTPYPTGKVLVELKNGIPAYTIVENVAWDHIPYSDDASAVIRRADAVCFGTLAQRSPTSRQTILNFLNAMPDDSRHLRIFDVNLRAPYWNSNIVAESLESCNILKLNDEELPVVASAVKVTAKAGNQAATALAIMEKYALRALILTCGARESYIFAPEGTSRLATPHVRVADTVGAGDSFTAAFTASVLLGHTVTEAHESAVKRAAYVCTRHGATPPVP